MPVVEYQFTFFKVIFLQTDFLKYSKLHSVFYVFNVLGYAKIILVKIQNSITVENQIVKLKIYWLILKLS